MKNYKIKIKVNQYITVALISAKKFKNIIFKLFAVPALLVNVQNFS